MPGTVPGTGTKGNKTTLRAAVLAEGAATAPTAGTATIDGAVAASATTITLAAGGFGSANVQIYPPQWLEAVDTDGNTYVFRVSADYTDGSTTTLTVDNVLEAIPDQATIQFPTPMRLRTSADLSSDTAIETFSTFDHAGSSSASPGETTNTFTANGFFSHYDAAFKSIQAAQRLSRNVYIERQLEKPGAAFTGGQVDSFVAIVSSLNTNAPNDGSVAADMTFQVNGDITTAQPTTT